MKNFIKSLTEFLVALGTVATACATIYSEYNKQKKLEREVSSTTKFVDSKKE